MHEIRGYHGSKILSFPGDTHANPQGIICPIDPIGTQSQKQCLKGTGTEIAVGILRSVFVYVLSLKLSTIQSDNSVQNALVFQPTNDLFSHHIVAI